MERGDWYDEVEGLKEGEVDDGNGGGDGRVERGGRIEGGWGR